MCFSILSWNLYFGFGHRWHIEGASWSCSSLEPPWIVGPLQLGLVDQCCYITSRLFGQFKRFSSLGTQRPARPSVLDVSGGQCCVMTNRKYRRHTQCSMPSEDVVFWSVLLQDRQILEHVEGNLITETQRPAWSSVLSLWWLGSSGHSLWWSHCPWCLRWLLSLRQSVWWQGSSVLDVFGRQGPGIGAASWSAASSASLRSSHWKGHWNPLSPQTLPW